jgi:quercetin dioxygenase-like cupin family protein
MNMSERKDFTKEELESLIDKRTATFRTRKPDWAAFEDAKIEGYKRAQHRFIGAGASGKFDDINVVEPGNFTLSIMYVEPGQGNASHTHEVEEVFFMLQGHISFFVENEKGERAYRTLGPWDAISCPAGVMHGYDNTSVQPAYFQVMLGKGKPQLMGYKDPELYARRDAHLKGE